MSAPYQHPDDDAPNAHLEDEDIVEVLEDDGGDPPMDEDDDGEGYDGPTGLVPDDGQGPYDGEIVIGAPGPGEEEEAAAAMDNSWGHSELHASGQSVFTVALHPLFPNPPLAVSGGEDDAGFIFSPLPSSSGSRINAESFPATRLSGHSDSVVAVGWSFDGELVATGGMDGKVRVWRHVKRGNGDGDEWKDWEFLTSLETGSEITWVQWHPKGNVLAAGCEDAQIWMWQLPSGSTMTVLSSHTLSSQAGLWAPDGKTLLTTSLDSSLILWDPRTSSPVFKASMFVAPNSPELDPASHGITSVAISPNGQLAAVGGASGAVKLVNLAAGTGAIIGVFKGHRQGESVEALAFIDVLNGAGGGKGVVLVSGGTDGRGYVWDVATGRVRAELSHEEPITSLAPHPAPHVHLITSASADGTLKTWDVRTGQLIEQHTGHAGLINGVAVARAPEGLAGERGLGQVVLSAGDEGVSLIWKM